MTITTGIIDHGNSPLVMIRQDYLNICSDAPNPHCAAAILGVFEYWTAVKRAKGKDLWVWKTYQGIRADMLNLFGITATKKAAEWLVEVGYLGRRINPKNTWDKTYQYLFKDSVIREALGITAEALNLTNRDIKNIQSDNQIQPIGTLNVATRSDKSSVSFTEITTETTVMESTKPEITKAEVTLEKASELATRQTDDDREAFSRKFYQLCNHDSNLTVHRKKCEPHINELWNAGYRLADLGSVDLYITYEWKKPDIYPSQIVEIIRIAVMRYGSGIAVENDGDFDGDAADHEADNSATEADSEPASYGVINNYPTQFDPIWNHACLGQYQLQLNKATYDTWFADTKFVSFADGTLTLHARNHYAADYLATYYAEMIMRHYSRDSAQPVTTLQLVNPYTQPVAVQREPNRVPAPISIERQPDSPRTIELPHVKLKAQVMEKSTV